MMTTAKVYDARITLAVGICLLVVCGWGGCEERAGYF